MKEIDWLNLLYDLIFFVTIIIFILVILLSISLYKDITYDYDEECNNLGYNFFIEDSSFEKGYCLDYNQTLHKVVKHEDKLVEVFEQ